MLDERYVHHENICGDFADQYTLKGWWGWGLDFLRQEALGLWSAA
jgi:hypothetical protein